MADSKVNISMADPKVTLKLLIHKKDQRLLFAEASKEFVDFLFSLLVLPVGTVMRLLEKRDMIGSLSQLYKSISDLDNDYLQSNQVKNIVLQPRSLLPRFSPQVPILPSEAFASPATPYPTADLYKCTRCKQDTFYTRSDVCKFCCGPTCFVENPYALKPLVNANGGGFVKAPATYMVMDDLAVSPMPTSTVTNMNLFNKFNIKDSDSVEEKTVHIGMNEALEVLKHSLSSKTVLTDVFLRGVVVNDENPAKRCKKEGLIKMRILQKGVKPKVSDHGCEVV